MTQANVNMLRMFSIIEEVFEARTDPEQIQVTPAQLKKLKKIHPSTLSELADSNGPLIWVLLIPTLKEVMHEFLKGAISEKEMLKNTKVGEIYNCIYLCSVTSLPEARGKGLSKKVCMDAISKICSDYPIDTLFVWPFTKEGAELAKKLALQSKLDLLFKEEP